MSVLDFFQKTGPFIQAPGDAHFATLQEVEAARLLGDEGIRLGYYRAPEDRGEGWGRPIRYSGDAHLITVAPTGSGKGRDVLVSALIDYKGSCIVIDPKGQLAAITKAHRERLGKVIILNPLRAELQFDLGPSANYNPMAHLNPKSDSFGPDCEAIADSIVVRDDANAHFSDSAQILITGVMMHLATHSPEDSRNLHVLQQRIADVEMLGILVREALHMDQDGFIRSKLARFAAVTGEDRELRSIISTADTQCGFINNKAIARSLSRSDFSFRDLKRELTTVYLVLPAKFIGRCGKWFRLVLASAISELWSEPKGKYPILAMMDEFAQLGRLSVIADAMGMAREFGLQLWPVLQDLTQLKEHYGDRWETFLGGAAVRQFFAPREHFTADYVSKMCGVRTAITHGQSVQHAQHLLQPDGRSSSWGQHLQPLLHPHNVLGIGPQETIILGPQNVVIDGFRKSYLATEEIRGSCSPDPYHASRNGSRGSSADTEDIAPPPSSFAERDSAFAKAGHRSLQPRKSVFLRLLTPGESDNPVWNIARKVEFVVTLPFRLIGALFAAPFALHNKPPGAVLGVLAFFALSIFGESAWEIHLTKETLHEAAKRAAEIDTLVHGSNVKDDESYVGMREAELDAETRAGFLQFVTDNGLGPLEDMTGFKDLSGVRRLNARISGYQHTVAPHSFGGDGDGNGVTVWWGIFNYYLEPWDRTHHQPYILGFGQYPKDFLEEYYDLPTRTPYGKKLYLNAKNGCRSDLLPCTSMDPKVIDAYDARHPWYKNIFRPSSWLMFQGRNVVETPR